MLLTNLWIHCQIMPEGEHNLMTGHVRMHMYFYTNKYISSSTLYPPGGAVLLDVGVAGGNATLVGALLLFPAEFTATTLMV